jgi:hypothetical protein
MSREDILLRSISEAFLLILMVDSARIGTENLTTMLGCECLTTVLADSDGLVHTFYKPNVMFFKKPPKCQKWRFME